jgi:hypothetical protein
MSETNKDVIRRYQDAWNEGDIDALEGSMYRLVDGRTVEHWAFADELGTLHRFGADVPPEWLALGHRSI